MRVKDLVVRAIDKLVEHERDRAAELARAQKLRHEARRREEQQPRRLEKR